jgi:hypothetical protein
MEWTQAPQRIDRTGADHHALIYDPVRRVTLLFGGHAGENGAMVDTWANDATGVSSAIRDCPADDPPHGVRYTTQSRRHVRRLGRAAFNDTGVGWSGGRRPRQRSAARSHAWRTTLNATTSCSAVEDSPVTGDTWELMERHGINSQSPALDPQRSRDGLAHGRSLHVRWIHQGFNDLWSFDGEAWRQIPRADAALPQDGIAFGRPYAVGYRLINHWDHSRAVRPA